MVGKNPLWVAKMPGRRGQTMLATDAAGTEGAQESEVEAISVVIAGAPERVPHKRPVVVNTELASNARFSPPEGPRIWQ